MFGDDSQQQQDNGGMPMDQGMPQDQGAMSQPMSQPMQDDHHMSPAYPADEPVMPAYSDPAPAPAVSNEMGAPVQDAATHPEDHELLAVKQDALNALAPLVGNLEQSPEEKFRTTMMLIQASDDRTLVKAAYNAAQAITDEKSRAQALLDVINEINYFTSHA